MEKLVMILLMISCLIFLSFSVSAAVINVPTPYATIQDAVDNSSNGDIILVDDGSYNETLTIDKNNLNISSVNGASSTIINPTDTSAGGIWIKGNGNIINGFTIRDFLDSSYENKIIRIDGNNSIVKNNIIQGNLNQAPSDQTEYGILIYGKENLIQENEVYDIGYIGVNVVGQPHSDASDNIIRDNNIHDIGIYGIGIDRSHDNEITQNEISNLVGGTLWGDYYDPLIWVWGIIVWGENSSGTEIYNQNLNSLPNGIALSAAKNIEIRDSEIKDNDNIGIRLAKSSWLVGKVEYNLITNNLIINNSFGIFVGDGDLTKIGYNDINYNLILGNIIGLNSSADEETNATFNNWGDCSGPSGIGSGTGDSIYGNASYFPWLGACIYNKTREPSCVLETDNVTLSANVSSLVCVDNVRFGININGIWNNYSYTSQQGDIYSFILSSLLVGGENVSWTVYADDCYNHTTSNGIHDFYVNRKTNLSINPSSPDGANSWYISEPIFTLTNNDASFIWYQWDSVDIFNYTSPFNLDNIPNSPPKESAGILELNYWSDICNESIQTEILQIDLVSPQITDLTPLGTIYNNLMPTISAYLEEIYQSNSGINKPSVVMQVDGADVNASVNDADSLDAIVSFVPSSDLAPGLHNVSVYVEDNAGRNNQTFWEFYINITPIFDFNVFSPNDSLYGERKINFNMSASEELDEISYIDLNENNPKWKKLCSDCDEYGNKKKKTKTFNDGKHNITIKAIDKFGQEKEVNIEFEVDSREPKISKTEPRKNQVTNGSSFYIKYTEANLNQVSVSFNPTIILADCNESGINKECFIDLNLTDYDGSYIDYWFSISDFVREINSSIIRVLVDTSSPVLSVNLPLNVTYGRLVPFDLEVSEDVKLEYYDNLDANPRWRTLCTRCDEYNKNKAFSRGNHDILIRALDDAGNSDVDGIGFFVSY